MRPPWPERSLPIDREDVARRLGFDQVAANSLDASSDRDFVLELAFVLALLAEHLSRLGRGMDSVVDDRVRFSGAAAGVLHRLVHHAAEDQSGRAGADPRSDRPGSIGNLQSLLVLIKGLPLAYNRDLQEDKRPLFDSVDTVSACLELAAPIVREARLNEARDRAQPGSWLLGRDDV